MISFRIDWLYLLGVHGTLKHLLQHNGSKASILQLLDAKSWLIGKDPDAGKDWGQEEKGVKEHEIIGWHH